MEECSDARAPRGDPPTVPAPIRSCTSTVRTATHAEGRTASPTRRPRSSHHARAPSAETCFDDRPRSTRGTSNTTHSRALHRPFERKLHEQLLDTRTGRAAKITVKAWLQEPGFRVDIPNRESPRGPTPCRPRPRGSTGGSAAGRLTRRLFDPRGLTLLRALTVEICHRRKDARSERLRNDHPGQLRIAPPVDLDGRSGTATPRDNRPVVPDTIGRRPSFFDALYASSRRRPKGGQGARPLLPSPQVLHPTRRRLDRRGLKKPDDRKKQEEPNGRRHGRPC